MEQTTAGSQTNCQWCGKAMNNDAIPCTSCGKLRKDIYTGKMQTYFFCILGGVLIGSAISFWKGNTHEYPGYNYYNTNTASADNTTSYILLALGIASAIIGIYNYIKVSRQLKTYWWG